MTRNALTLFFRSAVVAALPLVSAACGSQRVERPSPICDGGFYALDLTAGGCGAGGVGTIVEAVDGGLGDAGCAGKCAEGGLLLGCTEQRNGDCQPIVVCRVGCVGRAPAGLAPANARGNAHGRYFAEAAHMEAASVAAFRRLRAELHAFGAPRALLDACTSAARDEARHARSAARLARRFGSTPPSVRLSAPRPRTAMELAIENVREGCIGETFGALIATWQLAVAADAQIRAHLQSIIGDETRHAELAWAVEAWLGERLTSAERAHLASVRLDELGRLALALEPAADGELRHDAGIPSPPVARALHRAFAAEVARRA
ncbi:MAG TPA: hypothetical protein VGL86_16730 [Polyangia bacterium]